MDEFVFLPFLPWQYCQGRKTNLSVCFLGKVTAQQFWFKIYWPLVSFKLMVKISSNFVAFLENTNFNFLLCSSSRQSRLRALWQTLRHQFCWKYFIPSLLKVKSKSQWLSEWNWWVVDFQKTIKQKCRCSKSKIEATWILTLVELKKNLKLNSYI